MSGLSLRPSSDYVVGETRALEMPHVPLSFRAGGLAMKSSRAEADGGLRRIFREHLPSYHWTPVETAMTGAGVPDCNCCYAGVEFWIEYKFSHAWSVVLRPEQIGWLLRR